MLMGCGSVDVDVVDVPGIDLFADVKLILLLFQVLICLLMLLMCQVLICSPT